MDETEVVTYNVSKCVFELFLKIISVCGVWIADNTPIDTNYVEEKLSGQYGQNKKYEKGIKYNSLTSLEKPTEDMITPR